ncbi:unnamed protein product [Rotaria socialis]|uniref:Uncharacterized protein n=1 Tax=Rotaria socialis TaxID=392032 RepID=A0A820UJI1_9BILA|nr:unnamed protein product [Rotaria socialis]CAF4485961.1 unnamed protein product [Rotaria socialis]
MYSNETSNFHVKIQGICHLLPLAIDRQSDLHCELCLIPYETYLTNQFLKDNIIEKNSIQLGQPLFRLNQIVCIDHPQLNIPWFNDRFGLEIALRGNFIDTDFAFGGCQYA